MCLNSNSLHSLVFLWCSFVSLCFYLVVFQQSLDSIAEDGLYSFLPCRHLTQGYVVKCRLGPWERPCYVKWSIYRQLVLVDTLYELVDALYKQWSYSILNWDFGIWSLFRVNIIEYIIVRSIFSTNPTTYTWRVRRLVRLNDHCSASVQRRSRCPDILSYCVMNVKRYGRMALVILTSSQLIHAHWNF